jgi:tRNA threonylcarbamoyladenosine biosynthesis protein TsaB
MAVLLALESATEGAGVALADERGLLAEVRLGRGRRHAETLAPAVQEACRLAQVALADLDALAVDVGPGLFTGLRVGLATAKGLAMGLGRPLVGLSSLQLLLAGAAALRVRGPVLAVVDARRGEVFWTHAELEGAVPWWRTGAPAPVASKPEVGPPAALAWVVQELVATGRTPLLLGDGAWRYREELGRAGGQVADQALTGLAPGLLAEVALAELAAGRASSAEAVGPLYLREADAQIDWARRHPTRPRVEPSGAPEGAAPPVEGAPPS